MNERPQYFATPWGKVMVYGGKRYRKDAAGYGNPFPLGGWVEITDPLEMPSSEADAAVEAHYRSEAVQELDREFPADLDDGAQP